MNNLDIDRVVYAYSKQLSLNRFVQAYMALKCMVESAILEEGEQQSDDVDQEVGETEIDEL